MVLAFIASAFLIVTINLLTVLSQHEFRDVKGEYKLALVLFCISVGLWIWFYQLIKSL